MSIELATKLCVCVHVCVCYVVSGIQYAAGVSSFCKIQYKKQLARIMETSSGRERWYKNETLKSHEKNHSAGNRNYLTTALLRLLSVLSAKLECRNIFYYALLKLTCASADSLWLCP